MIDPIIRIIIRMRTVCFLIDQRSIIFIMTEKASIVLLRLHQSLNRILTGLLKAREGIIFPNNLVETPQRPVY
mgnify:CR=1 FL=1